MAKRVPTLPRVTEIIAVVPGLMPDYERWDPNHKGMDRGTAVDTGANLLYAGYAMNDLEIDERIYPYLLSLSLWLRETHFAEEHINMIQNELRNGEYRGHPDVYNIEWTIDTKAAVKAKWHKLQSAAYQNLTHSRKRGSLYLQSDGSMAKLDEHKDRADLGAFLSALKLYQGEQSLQVYRDNLKRWMAA